MTIWDPLNGRWHAEDGEPTANIDVRKREVKFIRDGTVGSLHFKGEDQVWLELGKYTYAARHESGILRWDNGEVWTLGREATRAVPAATMPTSKSTAKNASKYATAPPRALAKFFTGIQAGEPGEYRVLQGVVFKKPGADPTTDKGIRKVQAVGSTMRTTGNIFTGKNESEWVELDSPDTPGWVLVQGPGVGMPGPLLQKVEPNQEAPFIMRTTSPKAIIKDPDTDEQTLRERKFVIQPSASMTEVKAWLSLLFKLNVSKLRILKPEDQRPSTGNFVVWHNRGDDEFVPDSWSVKEAGFRDGDLMEYTCFGFDDSSDSDDCAGISSPTRLLKQSTV